nr:hypothetical protein [Tanacetum cinerariifolium]
CVSVEMMSVVDGGDDCDDGVEVVAWR